MIFWLGVNIPERGGQLGRNMQSDILYISLSTVKTHISHILAKLVARNRREATEIALEKGLI